MTEPPPDLESATAAKRSAAAGDNTMADSVDPSAVFRRRGARVTARRMLRQTRRILGDSPAFLPIVLRLTPLGTSRRITEGTEVVIEGFPRSGNTFATFALLEAEGRAVRVSSHGHIPAQVKVAVGLGKPTLFVIREPVGCIASLLTAAPHVPFEAAIEEYIHHHREVLPYRSGFVVGTFAQTTTDFSAVIEALNRRFGTSFAPFTQTPESVDRVFARIDAHYRETYGDRASERVVPRPSPARRAEKEWLTEQLKSSRYARLMAQAHDVYNELTRSSN